MPLRKFVSRGFQRYWRVSRGLRLSVRGCVLDACDSVLLIRHATGPEWCFPGGGVEKGETSGDALIRVLEGEAGIEVDGCPDLFNLYCNLRVPPGEHIALFVVRSWSERPNRNRAIAERAFFPLSGLPAGVHQPTRVRLQEILGSGTPAEMW